MRCRARRSRCCYRRDQDHGLKFLKEPLWPPENFEGLAELRGTTGIPISSGENVSTPMEFEREPALFTHAASLASFLVKHSPFVLNLCPLVGIGQRSFCLADGGPLLGQPRVEVEE